MWYCSCDPALSRFSRTPTCDGQPDGQTDARTDGHRPMASTADASSRSKNYAGGYYASTDRILWLGDSDAAKNVVV